MQKGQQAILDRDSLSHDSSVATELLAWYDRERRELPWRAASSVKQDPYKVWLSEIMLQQTTVKAVTPRYDTFLRRWPDVTSLARAELGEVLAAWAGLGYYARARNLHACARAVAGELGGAFPESEKDLRKLPGIGAYTAAAIAAIAFGKRATPVDGNIERVVARLFAVATPLPTAKPEIKALAERLTPAERAGDFAQGLMDLGATICTPRSPDCGHCPLEEGCRAEAEGLAEVLPYRATKIARPTRRGVAFVAVRADGAVLLRERPLKGLLGGMLETPSTPWEETAPSDIEDHAPVAAIWDKLPGLVEHTFTHFHLKLLVYRAEVSQGAMAVDAARPEQCRWLKRDELADAALPSVMRKVIAHALDARVKSVAKAKPGARAVARASA